LAFKEDAVDYAGTGAEEETVAEEEMIEGAI